MAGVRVSVAPPTPEGRLHPRYLNSSGILVLRSDMPRDCPFGVNVDCLTLDFDERGVLAGVELRLRMSRWRGNADVSHPGGAAGDIVLAGPRPASCDYDWPVSVSNDMQTDAARIAFGSGDYNRVVLLSKLCCALVLDDKLTGFCFSLRPRTPRG